MRIFTLGKNGIPLFFFALILFNGTYSSYGQECPTVDESISTQYFCDSQDAEIGDLVVTTGTNVTWYASPTSTTPLQENRFIENGATYYAGTSDPNECIGENRAAVTVSVASQPVILGLETSFDPNTSTKQSVGGVTVVGLCVADIDNPGVTISDFRTNASDVNQVRWYSARTGGSPLTADTQLQNNVTYYAALVSTEGECETNRSGVTVRLFSEEAPEGQAEQIFCTTENPTLGDIVATGNNNYYRTATSQTELSPNTPLVEGRTYFVSTVGENCESFDRLAVTVRLQEATAGEDVSETVCLAELEERLNSETPREIFLSLLDEGVATTGTFNPSIDQLAAQYSNNPYGSFTTTYTVTNDAGCEDSAEVALTVTENLYAGEDTDLVFCQAEIQQLINVALSNPDAAEEMLLGMIGDDVDTNGQFSTDLQQIAAGYFAAVQNDALPFITTTVYTVGQGTACEDSAAVSITVNEGGEDFDDIFVTLCSEEIDNPTADGIRDYYQNQVFLAGLPATGTFSPSPAELHSQFQAANGIGTFATDYTVDTDCGTVTVNVAVQVIENQVANAGEIADASLESTSPVYVLDENVLSADATRGGTFTAAEGVLNAEGNFNPSIGAGEYTITYTVDESTPCVEGQDSTTFTITVAEDTTEDPTEDGDIFVQICSDQINNPTLGGFRDFFQNQIALNSDLPLDGTFNPSMQELLAQYQSNPIGTFTTSYTVNVDGSDVTIQVSVQVVETQTANAGEIADITVQEDATNVVVLDESVLNADATRGGMFTAAEGVLNAEGNFDPSVGPGEYTITYTVDESIACVEGQESTTFTITVTEDTTEEDDIFVQICSDDIDSVNASAFRDFFQNQIFLNSDLPLDGTFNPTMQELLAQYQSNPIGTFTTSYTVNVDGSDVTIQVAVQVIESQTANAGEIADISVQEDATNAVVLNESVLSADATRGGTFTAAEGVLNAEGNFDPSVGPGVYTITYTVDESVACVEGQDSTTFTITVTEDTTEEDDIFVQICSDQINNPTLGGFRDFFQNQIALNSDLPLDGTFNPSMEELLAQYQNNPIDTFTTSYTVNVDGSDVTIQVSIQVLETETADAGEISDITVACDATNVVVLDDTLLSADATRGGSFTAEEGVLNAEGNFDPSVGPGEYTITYTVDESLNCVEGQDSTTFTITVNQGGDVEASDILVQLCSTEIDNPTVSGFTAYFRNVIRNRTSYPVTGTFDPAMAELVAQYEEEPIGTFTTNYTVATPCGTVSFDITVQIIEPEDANAGGEIAAEFCVAQDEDIQLTSLLPEGAQTTGSFSAPYQDGTFNPSVAGLGEFTITYSVVEGPCVIGEDSATITITVTDTAEAPVADDVTFCVAEGATVADLVATGENIRWYTDAELSAPADEDDALVAGTYYVTQTTAGGCESEAAEVTVTLNDAATPTLVEEGNVFCESDRPTIADLSSNIVETGTVTWYDAAIGGEAYDSADLLQDGATYYASLADATTQCESGQRLAVTVNLETCELLIPEAFSPNGDGINDIFEIQNVGEQYPNYTIEIFNRWGNVVYQGNASTPFWNGESTESRTLGSNVLPVGVYFYILNYNDGQTAPTQGRVYLSR